MTPFLFLWTEGKMYIEFHYFYECRNINDVDKTMDELNEQSEIMKQIHDAFATSTFVDFDEVLSTVSLTPLCPSSLLT